MVAFTRRNMLAKGAVSLKLLAYYLDSNIGCHPDSWSPSIFSYLYLKPLPLIWESVLARILTVNLAQKNPKG